MATNKNWKAAERFVAKFFGGTRVKALGSRAIDVDAGWLRIEVKYRQELPEWIVAAVAKARRHATEPGNLGIAVLRGHGEERGLVVLDMHDFREWFGREENQPSQEDTHGKE